MTNPVEFNFGDDEEWTAGFETTPGVWTADHTYTTGGDFTVSARDQQNSDETTVTVPEPEPPPAEMVLDSVSPADTIANGATLTANGSGLTGTTRIRLNREGGGTDFGSGTVVVSDTEVTCVVPEGLAGVNVKWVTAMNETDSRQSNEITLDPVLAVT